jgi:hypothetical protein
MPVAFHENLARMLVSPLPAADRIAAQLRPRVPDLSSDRTPAAVLPRIRGRPAKAAARSGPRRQLQAC